MTITSKIKALDAHSIPYKLTDNKLIVDSMEAYTAPFEHTEDATDWTNAVLFAWLGY